MRKSNHIALRQILRAHPMGLTTNQMVALAGVSDSSIRRSLETMPDAYIAGWVGPKRAQYLAVWRVVVPPPNAPHPVRDPAGPAVTIPMPAAIAPAKLTRWVTAPPWLT